MKRTIITPYNNAESDEVQSPLFVAIEEEPRPSKKILHVHIAGEIPHLDNSMKGYLEVIHRISELTDQDEIYLHINSGGGSVVVAAQLVNALRATPATITSVLEGVAFSSATFLFLLADRYIVHDHTLMMFHTFSFYGLSGKETEISGELEAYKKLFFKMAKTLWVPFLTTKEVDDILAGKDMWLEADEIKKRLKNAVKQINKQKRKKEDNNGE